MYLSTSPRNRSPLMCPRKRLAIDRSFHREFWTRDDDKTIRGGGEAFPLPCASSRPRFFPLVLFDRGRDECLKGDEVRRRLPLRLQRVRDLLLADDDVRVGHLR